MVSGVLINGQPVSSSTDAEDQLAFDGIQNATFVNNVSIDSDANNAKFGNESIEFSNDTSAGRNLLVFNDTQSLCESFTLAAFVKSTGTGNQRLFSTFDGSGGLTAGEIIFDSISNGSLLRVLIAVDNPANPGTAITDSVTFPAQFNDGQYHHVAMTYDDGFVRVFGWNRVGSCRAVGRSIRGRIH